MFIIYYCSKILLINWYTKYPKHLTFFFRYIQSLAPAKKPTTFLSKWYQMIIFSSIKKSQIVE